MGRKKGKSEVGRKGRVTAVSKWTEQKEEEKKRGEGRGEV